MSGLQAYESDEDLGQQANIECEDEEEYNDGEAEEEELAEEEEEELEEDGVSSDYNTGGGAAMNGAFIGDDFAAVERPQRQLSVKDPLGDVMQSLASEAMGTNHLRDKPDHWMIRNMVVNFRGSLQELAKNSSDATVTFGIKDLASFLGISAPPVIASKAGGRGPRKTEGISGNVLMKSFKIISFKNDFPCALGVRCEGLKNTKRIYMNKYGQMYDFVALADDSGSKLDVTVYDGESALDAKFLKKFPDWNCENIDTGLVELENEPVTLVRINHPVVYLIDIACERKGIDIRYKEKQVGNFYQIARDTVNRAMEILRSSMESGLPTCDLRKIALKFERANVAPATPTIQGKATKTGDAVEKTVPLGDRSPWVSEVEIYGRQMFSESMKKHLLSQTLDCTVVVRMEFKPIIS